MQRAGVIAGREAAADEPASSCRSQNAAVDYSAAAPARTAGHSDTLTAAASRGTGHGAVDGTAQRGPFDVARDGDPDDAPALRDPAPADVLRRGEPDRLRMRNAGLSDAAADPFEAGFRPAGLPGSVWRRQRRRGLLRRTGRARRRGAVMLAMHQTIPFGARPGRRERRGPPSVGRSIDAAPTPTTSPDASRGPWRQRREPLPRGHRCRRPEVGASVGRHGRPVSHRRVSTARKPPLSETRAATPIPTAGGAGSRCRRAHRGPLRPRLTGRDRNGSAMRPAGIEPATSRSGGARSIP